jgi:hypothetical protein
LLAPLQLRDAFHVGLELGGVTPLMALLARNNQIAVLDAIKFKALHTLAQPLAVLGELGSDSLSFQL